MTDVDLSTLTVLLGAGYENITDYIRRIQYWRSPMPAGIGRFELFLNDVDFDLHDICDGDDFVSISLAGKTWMTGYVDVPNPKILEALEHHNLGQLILSGRDSGQDLMNKTYDKVFWDETNNLLARLDDIVDELFDESGSMIAYTSSSVLDRVYASTEGRSFLFDTLQRLLEDNEFEGFVDKQFVWNMFSIGSQNSGIILKKVNGATDNNIIKIVDYIPKDTLDLRNIIIAYGPEVDDHLTEGTANIWEKQDSSNDVTISDYINDDPTTPRKGVAAIKCTNDEIGVDNLVGLQLSFPNIFLYYLDFSKISEADLSFWLYYTYSGATNNHNIYIKFTDTDANTISTVHPTLNYPKDQWAQSSFKIGQYTNDEYYAGATFNWKVVKIGIWLITIDPNDLVDYLLIDHLQMPHRIYAVADHSPGSTCQICSQTFPASPDYKKRHWPVSKEDVDSYIALTGYADALAYKRMNPLERLFLIAHGIAGFVSNNWAWNPGYNVTVNIPDLSINSASYRLIEMLHTIEIPEDTIPNYTVQGQLIPYNAKLDSTRFKYGTKGNTALLQRLHQRLKAIEQNRGYVP